MRVRSILGVTLAVVVAAGVGIVAASPSSATTDRPSRARHLR